MQYTVSQCTVCQEAWPLKSKPRSPYVCSRCSRDEKSPKILSSESSMIPSPVPNELKDFTQVEEMLIARTLPITRVYIKPCNKQGFCTSTSRFPASVRGNSYGVLNFLLQNSFQKFTFLSRQHFPCDSNS